MHNPHVLVVVRGGMAEVISEGKVEVAVIDVDNIEAGEGPGCLPSDEGWERLVSRLELEIGKHVVFESVE